MDRIKEGYNRWAGQYDTSLNKTRDLEAKSLQQLLDNMHFNRALEIGCGTGKNTQVLQYICDKVLAVDFSEEMLAIARKKVPASNVSFIQADITEEWDFAKETFDLITFSLVLEHIKNLTPIFEKAARILTLDGMVYVGELHPFKQYGGTKARFTEKEATTTLACFTHHISDFTDNASAGGLKIEKVAEFFDTPDKSTVPRILSLLFKKR